MTNFLFSELIQKLNTFLVGILILINKKKNFASVITDFLNEI